MIPETAGIQASEAGAEAIYRDVLAMTRKELGDGHPAVAGAISNLASSLEFQGRLAEAEPLHGLNGHCHHLRVRLGGVEPDQLNPGLENLAASSRLEFGMAEHPAGIAEPVGERITVHPGGHDPCHLRGYVRWNDQ